MKFEITFGNEEDNYYAIVEAGNIFQGCIFAMQQCIEERKTFPIGPFHVINLETDTKHNIGMSLITELLATAAEEVEVAMV